MTGDGSLDVEKIVEQSFHWVTISLILQWNFMFTSINYNEEETSLQKKNIIEARKRCDQSVRHTMAAITSQNTF